MRHLADLLATNRVSSEERKAQYYRLLAHETERLHRMVESLLSFGRMQAGSSAWRLEPADTVELVRGVVEEFHRESQSDGREVVCEAEDNLPPIRADREALSRAISNLLENAEKYSEPGAPIRVLARRAGDSIHISVEDQGAGIPREQQKKLFERFVRGDDAQRAGVRGIGVGLALVKSVAEAHGGSVRLASEPGRGSTFTLVIPCHES
jgi:signal transduction histidine kinase